MHREPKDEITLPPCFSEEIKVDNNIARQMLMASTPARACLSNSPPYLMRSDGSEVRILTDPDGFQPSELAIHVSPDATGNLAAALSDPSNLRWVGDTTPSSSTKVRDTWADCLTLMLEEKDSGRPGLRLPQYGAVHSVLGYWTTGSMEPATVVMPTGTGKTETMIALAIAQQPSCLLIVVPSDALRSQTIRKFESLGVLQQYGVIDPTAMRPIVGGIRHAFLTAEGARSFAKQCNVLVTTPAALFASKAGVDQVLLEECSHLFIDEAHHVEARTWRRIREVFEGKPIVQFTATPFREDGRRMAGRIVYSFPLREAQKHGYFSKINYISVTDLRDRDRAIGDVALKALRQDLLAKHDHILMARVNTVKRAEEVLEVYRQLAPDLIPVLLHSDLPSQERRASLESIRSRASRVIVCVNMLGEGFDLPSLKVAAVHDIHRSLGVTLQFIGRFARVAGVQIGDATVVAGHPQGRYDVGLRSLYAEEPDWNLIIRDLSESAVNQEQMVSEFELGFGLLPHGVPMRNIQPPLSTVVYRTHCENWKPQAASDLFADGELFNEPIPVSNQYHVAWFIAQHRDAVCWGDTQTVTDVRHDLYLLYWDQVKQLLYVHSSDNESVHEDLAKQVCGPEAQRITGETVYRAMAGISRLVPTNIGLLDVRNQGRRFSMYVGADVTEGFPPAESQTKAKTNMFAYGYEGGERVSIGVSLKGRIWSYRVASSIKHWMDWCNHVGRKLVQAALSVDEIMKGFIRPQAIHSRPDYVAIGLEWSPEALLSLSEGTRVERAGDDCSILDAEFQIAEFAASGPIRFNVVTSAWRAPYEITFVEGGMRYRATEVEVHVLTQKGARLPLGDYLLKHGLTVLFEKDTVVTRSGVLLKPRRDLQPFDVTKLIVIDWTGINLRKESQGPGRDPESIQFRTIEYVSKIGQWDVILDDDTSHEMADIVAMREEGDHLVIMLVHCKFSLEPPGARVDDLYEVCGQAQKSVRCRRDLEWFFGQIIRRETRRQKVGRSGFIIGDTDTLLRLQDRSRMLKPNFTVVIAQPGVSKDAISDAQIELLASTDIYLYEVAQVRLQVFCSA